MTAVARQLQGRENPMRAKQITETHVSAGHVPIAGICIKSTFRKKKKKKNPPKAG